MSKSYSGLYSDIYFYVALFEMVKHRIDHPLNKEDKDMYCKYFIGHITLWEKNKNQFTREDQLKVVSLLNDDTLKKTLLEYLLKH